MTDDDYVKIILYIRVLVFVCDFLKILKYFYLKDNENLMFIYNMRKITFAYWQSANIYQQIEC